MPACCSRASGEPLPPRPVVCTARCKGVDPDFLFGCLEFAPPSSSARTAASDRVRTALCRGATPELSNALGSAPTDKRYSIVSSLCGRTPPVRVRRVVERLRASAIFRPAIGAVRDQELRNVAPKCRSSHMQSCVALIKVVSDISEEKGRSLTTRRAHVGRHGRKRRTRSQAPGHLVHASADDDADEIKKGRGHLPTHAFGSSKCGFSIRPIRLPNGSATVATLIPSPTSCTGVTLVAPVATKC